VIPLLASERHARRLHASGPSDRCEICGETDADAIVVETHHVGGAGQDGMALRACANDHAAVTLAQQQYRHLLRRPDCPWWARRLLWHLDQAALLDRQARWHERYAHEDGDRGRPKEEMEMIRGIARSLHEQANAHRDLTQDLLRRHGSTPAGRRLLDRPAPHRGKGR